MTCAREGSVAAIKLLLDELPPQEARHRPTTLADTIALGRARRERDGA